MRRTTHLRWAIVAVLLTWSCVGVNRRTRTTVTGDGFFGEGTDVDRGCEGEELSRQEHRISGGGVRMRHESEDGWTLGGQMRTAVGRLIKGRNEDGQRFDPQHYQLWGLGIAAGMFGKYAGVEGGGAVVLAGSEAEVYPWARTSIGLVDRAWFELGVGPEDPLLVFDVLTLGGGLGGEMMSVRGGLTVHGRLILDAEPDGEPGRSLLLATESEIFNGGFFLDVRLRTHNVGLVLGGVLSEQPVIRFGLEVAFDRD